MLDRYVVLDIETTGFSKEFSKITEIAAIKLMDNKIIDKFQTLVNPEQPIPGKISELTGITDSMVYKQKLIQEILPTFVDFLDDNIVVGHNVDFDYGFLDYNYQKYFNKNLTNDKLCTIKIAKKLFPKIASCRLDSLCNYFDIKNERAHRAMGDTMATTKLFLKFQAIMHNNGIQERNDILNFIKDPLKNLNLSTSSLL